MPSSRRCSPRPSIVLALALLVVGAILGGCSASPAASASPAMLAVANAWVRPPMGMDRPAGGYLTITNPGSQADALVGASSPVARSVEVHETITGPSGMSGMQPVAKIEIPAGGSVELKPGGYHLMLMGVQTLTVGSTVEIVLTFEKAGKVTVKAEVKNG